MIDYGYIMMKAHHRMPNARKLVPNAHHIMTNEHEIIINAYHIITPQDDNPPPYILIQRHQITNNSHAPKKKNKHMTNLVFSC